MISLSTDIADLILQCTLNDNTYGLNRSIERMTTGYKINHAKDNAANFSIATDLSKKISSMLQIQQNTEDGVAMLQTAEGGLEEIQELLERLRDLSMRAANGTYDAQSRNAMQEEADAIVDEIERIKNSIQYNGMNLYENLRENTTMTSKLAKAAKVSSANNINDTNISLSDGGEMNSSPSDLFFETTVQETLPLTPNPSPTRGDGASSTIQQTTTASTRSMARAAAAPRAASNTIEGAESFTANETKTVTIDGVQYEIKNDKAAVNDISYSKDTNGQITFLGSNFTIKGQKDVAHNILINGSYVKVYGGDLDDQLKSLDSANDLYFYGGKGDDTITCNGKKSYL